MKKLSIQLRLFSQLSSNGFTLIELMVSSAIGLTIMSIILGATLSQRSLYRTDMTRIRLNQNMRGVLDIVGHSIERAGERLPANFPALLLDNEDSGHLTLRRSLINESLKVCEPINAGDSGNSIFVTTISAEPGCDYASQQANFAAWENYRTENGGSIKAYIYNAVTKEGEFFDFTGATDSGSVLSISSDGDTWSSSYPVGPSTLYILEQWEFMVDNTLFDKGTLELIENGELENPKKVAFGIDSFEVSAVLNSSVIQNTFTNTDSWKDLKNIDVIVSSSSGEGESSLTNSLSGSYFPRNVLSK